MKKLFFVVFYFYVATAFAQQTKLMIQTGHQTYAQNMSLSPDEKKIISVDSDGIGILWDVDNNKKLRVFQKVRDAQFDTDGRTLFLVYENGEFKSVDLSGSVVKAYPTSAEKSRPEVARYNRDAGLIFYRTQVTNVNTGKTTQMAMEKYGFEEMLYAPLKGQVVWAARNDKGNTFFFDVNSGSITKALKLDLGEYVIPNNISISQDNNTLLVSSSRRSNVLDFNTGSVLHILEPKEMYEDILSSVISPNGKNALLVMKKGMTMIDIETKKIVWEQSYNKYDYNKAIFNANGDKVFVVHNGGIDVINSLTGKLSKAITATTGASLNGLQLADNYTHLFTLSSNQFVVNWNLTTGRMEKPIRFESEKNAVEYVITPDGKEMIFSDFSYPTSKIRQIKLADNTQPVRYPQVDEGESIKNISLSFDKKYLLSSRLLLESEALKYPKSLSVYDVKTQAKILDLPASGAIAGFANTKNMIGTKNNWNDGNLSIYEVPSGRLLNQVTFPVNIGDHDAILFSPSDKYVATAYDKEFTIYEMATQKFIKFRNRTAVDVYAFTPNEKYFLTCSRWDGCIYFYDLQSQQYESAFKMQVTETVVKDVSFSKDGKFMYTTDANNTIKVWDFETQTLLATLYSFPDTNDWAVLTPDGHFDGTKGAQENMYYVKGVNTIDLSEMYEKFYTPQLLTRILNGEKINKEDIDIDNLHPKPRIKIQYAEKTRNLEVGDDNPFYASTTGVAELTINATAQDDRVDEIRLFHNGKIVNLATRGLFVTDDKTGNETKRYTINLMPGQNAFRAVALNGQRTESKADEITVNYKADNTAPEIITVQNNTNVPVDPVAETATLYLVVIGINKYQNEKLSLNYALADATAFKAEIEKDAKTVLGTVKTFFVTDNTADKKGITDALTEVQKNAKPQDVFVFYYAGHGYISEKTKEFYLVPTDVADIKNVDEELLQKGISSKMLQTYAIDIQAQKQIFILDACQSAGAFEALLTADANQQKSLAVVSRSTGTHWLAASGSKQFAQEFATLKHGAFTYVLLQALQGQAAANKMITVNGLKTFMQAQVPELMKKYNSSPQYPASYGLGNDFPVELIK